MFFKKRMAPKAAASAAVGRETRSASKGPDGSRAVSGGIQSASSFTGSKAGFPSRSSKAAGNANSAAVGGSAPPVAMKPIAAILCESRLKLCKSRHLGPS
jgi:hypothetical protein